MSATLTRRELTYRVRNLPNLARSVGPYIAPFLARRLGFMAAVSTLTAVVFRADGEHYYDDDPRLHHLRGVDFRCELRRRGFVTAGSVWYGPDCTRDRLGVLSKRVITTVGVNFMVDSHQNLTETEALNFHEMGTGVAAEAVGDTVLTAVESRTTGTQSEPAANQYRSVGTITATAGRAITEHGLFSASTAGTLFDRSVFTVINLLTGDSIQFTYTLTYTSGG